MADRLSALQRDEELAGSTEVRHLDVSGSEGFWYVAIAAGACQQTVTGGVRGSAVVQRSQRGLGVQHLDRIHQAFANQLIESTGSSRARVARLRRIGSNGCGM